MCLSCICLLAMHTVICVTFSLRPGVGGWLRLLLVALPGLFCLPFVLVRLCSLPGFRFFFVFFCFFFLVVVFFVVVFFFFFFCCCFSCYVFFCFFFLFVFCFLLLLFFFFFFSFLFLFQDPCVCAILAAMIS